jgi:LAO/AO transport system kinase
MREELAERLLAGDRRALARAITLVESGRTDHRADATRLLDRVGRSGRQALRIGLSGTPGVGKSSFIEAFGMMLTGQGLRVAVLAVDPSSARSGGSILGDKTRMERLSAIRCLHPPLAQPGAAGRGRPPHPRGGGAVRGGRF